MQRFSGQWRFGLLLGCLILSACEKKDESTLRVSGQIEGTAVTAGSKVGGRVEEVLVKEGQQVKQGEVLVRLDAAETQALANVARASLQQAEAALSKAHTGATEEQLRQFEAAAAGAQQAVELAENGALPEEIAAAQSMADAARAQMSNAQQEFERAQGLIEKQVIPQRQFDQAKAALDAATAQHRAAQEQANAVKVGARKEQIEIARQQLARAQAALDEVRRGLRPEDIEQAEAVVAGARANLERAEVGVKEMTILAPLDGLVESVDVRPGDLIGPGPKIRIVDPEDLELVVYVGAFWLGHIRLGQEIDLISDSHGDEVFKGKISYIAAEGEFTPRNLQTQEERVQQVFGVTIALDSHGGKLRPGMTVTAVIPKGPDAQVSRLHPATKMQAGRLRHS